MKEHTVIGRRVTQLENPSSGSVPLPCAECTEPTWCAPTSIPLIIQGARIICMQCMPADAFQAGVETAPGALEEVELARGPEGRRRAEKSVEHFNELARRRRGRP